jgi:hypothetical protein
MNSKQRDMSMSNKHQNSESPVDSLKNEASRQRWELFHRAIAHAKESNNAALHEADPETGDAECAGPLLTIVR